MRAADAQQLAGDAPEALFSLHDVAPATLSAVQDLVAALAELRVTRITLLVVPGREWNEDALDRLRALQREGYRLAGHGWSHQCDRIAGWGHWLHSCCISRRAAEHLALSPRCREALLHRCFAWFSQVGLAPPRLYVPPAWALGKLPRQALRRQPFELLETLSGVRSARTGRLWRLPLIGFEADTRARAMGLRAVNALNRAAATVWRRPLRIAIHPQDPSLLLRRDLFRALAASWRPGDYEGWAG
jgi:predicted deacetylase